MRRRMEEIPRKSGGQAALSLNWSFESWGILFSGIHGPPCRRSFRIRIAGSASPVPAHTAEPISRYNWDGSLNPNLSELSFLGFSYFGRLD
jgi:hypothetical protein